jgi:hypothetical protein
MFNRGYWTAKVHPFSEPRRKGVGHKLVASLQPQKILSLKTGASEFFDRSAPDPLER